MPFCNVTAVEVDLVQTTAEGKDENSAIIADYACVVVENLMRRYVEKRSTDCRDKPTTLPFMSWHDAVKAGAAVMERPYPHPSLFLHPLPLEICEYPCRPPAFLLAAKVPETTTSTLPANDDCSAEGGHGLGYRDMFALDGGAPAMVTVQQGECGLAVVSPGFRSAGSRGVYLMSSDATSCTIVACRVGLHPQLRDGLMTVTKGGAAADDESLAQRCCETFAAAMGHFDITEGLSRALHEMLWEAALPAWFHAALCGSQLGAAGGDAVRNAAELLARLRRVVQPTTVAFAHSDAPVLLVEWFVVGGVRSRKHTLPVLNTIFGAFFAVERQERGDTHCCSREERHILRPSFRLSEVLSGNSNEKGRAGLVRVDHRLREDGVCFWNFNTVLRQWKQGRAGERYSCAACYGILLDVGGGGCWPATLQPGTRNYPLTALRHALWRPGYHWICPLEREGVLCVWQGTSTARAESYLCLETTSAAGGPVDVSLSKYVALFLLRVESGIVTVKEHSATQLPVILRRCVWDKISDGALFEQLPDDIFLSLSTTPHCEPPDFVKIMRHQFALRAELSTDDVFAEEAIGMLI